jgi:hypothetical protein
MSSNFLGDVGETRVPSSIISSAELIAREKVELQKGMNFRDGGEQLSVFLVLAREGGFKDEWHEDTQRYIYEGHDSTTVEHGKELDQVAMYESGKLSENGKFFKAANAFKDGVRKEPLQVQVYEKLDPGVWYDKGIFDLVDAAQVREGRRTVFKFYLKLADAEFYSPDDPDTKERMLSAATKAEIWERCRGRCVECDTERGLRMVLVSGKGIELRCPLHGAQRSAGLL